MMMATLTSMTISKQSSPRGHPHLPVRVALSVFYFYERPIKLSSKRWAKRSVFLHLTLNVIHKDVWGHNPSFRLGCLGFDLVLPQIIGNVLSGKWWHRRPFSESVSCRQADISILIKSISFAWLGYTGQTIIFEVASSENTGLVLMNRIVRLKLLSLIDTHVQMYICEN